jgi:hypothetical protein
VARGVVLYGKAIPQFRQLALYCECEARLKPANAILENHLHELHAGCFREQLVEVSLRGRRIRRTQVSGSQLIDKSARAIWTAEG